MPGREWEAVLKIKIERVPGFTEHIGNVALAVVVIGLELQIRVGGKLALPTAQHIRALNVRLWIFKPRERRHGFKGQPRIAYAPGVSVALQGQARLIVHVPIRPKAALSFLPIVPGLIPVRQRQRVPIP